MAASYKPSPLSYGSPRASPFRRPESPASPSPLRQSTPNPSPSKVNAQVSVPPTMNMSTTPSRLIRGSTPTAVPAVVDSTEAWTPRGLPTPAQTQTQRRERDVSPTPVSRGTGSPGFGGMLAARSNESPSRNGFTYGGEGRSANGIGSADRERDRDDNALSKLQPAQVRELREGFQVLDRDGDGLVVRDDVVDMLNQLGLPSAPQDLAPFFPPSAPSSLTLPTYLSSMATLLSSLSPSSELLSAFSAFDDDDSGQIDIQELRDALLHTAPEPGEMALSQREVDTVIAGFTGRRAFGRQTGFGASGGGAFGGKRGEVFKYTEFVAGVQGGASVEKGEGREE